MPEADRLADAVSSPRGTGPGVGTEALRGRAEAMRLRSHRWCGKSQRALAAWSAGTDSGGAITGDAALLRPGMPRPKTAPMKATMAAANIAGPKPSANAFEVAKPPPDPVKTAVKIAMPKTPPKMRSVVIAPDAWPIS